MFPLWTMCWFLYLLFQVCHTAALCHLSGMCLNAFFAHPTITLRWSIKFLSASHFYALLSVDRNNEIARINWTRPFSLWQLLSSCWVGISVVECRCLITNLLFGFAYYDSTFRMTRDNGTHIYMHGVIPSLCSFLQEPYVLLMSDPNLGTILTQPQTCGRVHLQGIVTATCILSMLLVGRSMDWFIPSLFSIDKLSFPPWWSSASSFSSVSQILLCLKSSVSYDLHLLTLFTSVICPS